VLLVSWQEEWLGTWCSCFWANTLFWAGTLIRDRAWGTWATLLSPRRTDEQLPDRLS
jgi:hypothetical protein